ncbi:MAG: O-antigen ligase family protein [Rhodobacteraceae bacterium]|nr:O-antigen ligase family protein [Paracoccaceae bacterium]
MSGGRLRIDPALALIMVLGPLQWITLADVGLAIKPVHLPLAYGALRGVMRPSALTGLAPALFAAAFAAYLGTLTLALFNSANLGAGLSLLAKLAIHALLTLGLTLHLARLGRRRIFDSLLFGGAMGALVFLAVASLTLARQGLSLTGMIGRALATGDATALQFRLFLSLFNEGGAGAERTPASLRQVAMGFFYISALGAVPFLSGARGGRLRVVAVLSLGLSVALIAGSLSRSLVLALGLALAGLLIARAGRRADSVLLTLAGLSLVGALLFSLRETATLFDLISARFDGLDHDGRLLQYRLTIETIAQAPLIGHGTGHMQEFRAGSRNMVHNLFLSAWVQGGAAGLLTALLFSLTLVGLMLGRLVGSRNDLAQLTAALLPILPLLRSQIGGQGGNYALPEWLAISLTLAILCRREPVPDPRRIAPANGQSRPVEA